MATIINTPAGNTDSGNGMGMVLGLILLIAFILAFFAYGFPMMRNSLGAGVNTPQISVPEEIDVNINQTE